MVNWHNEEIKRLYKKLIIANVAQHLPGKPLTELPNPSENELSYLVNIASIYSISDNPEEKTIAYEIATRALDLVNDRSQEFAIAAEFILTRLGNFPGRELLRKRVSNYRENSYLLPIFLKYEELLKENQNKVNIYDGESIYLTDFQCTLLSLLSKNSTASVSAPTSAGKSFVFSLDAINRLKNENPVSIVYTVPTRALIRQVMKQVVDAIKKAHLKHIPVRCVPIPVDKEKITLGAIYVFTPERLMSFLQTDEGVPWITDLFVDEAQSIGDGSRGVILQSAIDHSLKKFRDIKLYFASPLSSNPEYLPNLFNRITIDNCPIERHSPVSQNIILASNKQHSRNKAIFELITPEQRTNIGEWQLCFSMSPGKSLLERKANFAKAITSQEECTIIYVNGPQAAIDQAKAFITEENHLEEIESAEVYDFIDFIKTHIHEDYDLAKVLKYGIAFHYGSMPPIVRSRLEDLFSENKLKYICCTSTLLQGVNLPAKSIIIENPKKGQGINMQRGDFLNLAGRAGRLLHEFQGNVWCLNPNSWEEHSYEGENLHEIKSAFRETMNDGGTLIQQIVTEGKAKDSKNEELGITATSKILVDYTLSGTSLLDSPFVTDDNRASLEKTDNICREITISFPDEILIRNQGVHPQRLEKLYNYLQSTVDLSERVLIYPFQCGSKYVKETFKILNSILGNIDNDSYKYFGAIAYSWMTGKPLKLIIETSISIQKKHEKFEAATKTITALIKTLDDDLRFRFVKYLRAYNDILAYILTERGEIELLATLSPWHLYLECGASDRVTLNLISLGLSRTTALLIAKEFTNNNITFTDDATPEDCLSQLVVSHNSFALPLICRSEIESLLHEY